MHKESITIDYRKRINRVFEYIDGNLQNDLSLEKVAAIAHFSPYHFHRIFKFITGETLNAYVSRQRIEKSAAKLLHTDMTVLAISQYYGFTDNATFTRAFKRHFGVSPSDFKKENPNRFSKIRQVVRKNGQEYPDREKYLCTLNELKNWITMNGTIAIKDLPMMNVAYVSCMGPQNLPQAFQKIMQWATPKGLMNENTRMLTIYHDSFKITEAAKVRMSACILLEETYKTEGEVRLTTIEAGKFIVGRFEIQVHEFEPSWTGLFLWMNENGYQKREAHPFEIYYNNFNEHPEKKAIVDLCIPIQ